MPLHPVLVERLNAALQAVEPLAFTPRDARLPPVPGKANAVIGMRRAGKTTFLRQLLAERRSTLPSERALYLSFDDDRLVGIGVEQLGFLREEFYRRHPVLRGRGDISLSRWPALLVRHTADGDKVGGGPSGAAEARS